MLQVSIYMKYPEQANLDTEANQSLWPNRDRKQISGYQGLGEGEARKLPLHGYEIFVWDNEKVLKLVGCNVCTTL